MLGFILHPNGLHQLAQTGDLLKGQHLDAGQEMHVLGHAVDAAQVAAVRHRQANVGDVAPEAVYELVGELSWRGSHGLRSPNLSRGDEAKIVPAARFVGLGDASGKPIRFIDDMAIEGKVWSVDPKRSSTDCLWKVTVNFAAVAEKLIPQPPVSTLQRRKEITPLP